MGEIPPKSHASVLAEQLGGSLEERFLAASAVRIRAPLELRQVVLDELSIDGLAGVGPVLISGSRIGTLRLTDVLIREGVIIEDCEIGNLELRSGRTTSFSLVRSGVRRCVLHECGSLVIDSTAITELAAISDIQHVLEMSRSSAGSIRLSSDGPSKVSTVSIVTTTIRDRLDIVGVESGEVRLFDVAATRAQLRHVCADRIALENLSIERDLAIHGVAGLTGKAIIGFSGVMGSVSVVVAPGSQSTITGRDATIRGDVTLGGPATVLLEDSCSIEGILRSAVGPESPQVQLSTGVTVHAIQPPALPIRSATAAREAAIAILGRDGVVELSILRDSLSRRPDDQDMAYFALRAAEQKSAIGIRRVSMWLRGQCFGWGVTFIHPLRTLLVGMLATAGLIFVLNPSVKSDWLGRATDALTSALGLWFNVGTGMPDGMRSAGWGLAAVVCTAMGISIITVLTGVAIRRLTR